MKGAPLILLVACACLILAPRSDAAVGDWRSYTRLVIRKIAASNTEVWAATEGGIIRSDIESGAVRTYSPTEGLPDKAILSVLVDGRTTWFGTREGGLLRFTSRPGLDQPVIEEPLLRGQITGIMALVRRDSVLYIGHNTGITVLDVRTLRVVETYHQLGPDPEHRNAQITALAVVGNRLVAGFAKGIAYADLDADLLLPNSWTYLTLFGSGGAVTPLDSVAAITTFRDGLFAAGRFGVYRQVSAGWGTVLPGGPARDLAVYDEAIWAATDAGLFWSTDGFAWTQVSGIAGKAFALAAVPGKMLVVAGTEGTFRLENRSAPTLTKVPGVDIPPSDSFTHLAVDTSGAVWVAPGATQFVKAIPDIGRIGIFALKNDRWLQFPSGENGMPFPSEIISGYVSVAVDAQNRIWAGNWGTGIAVIDQSTEPPTIHSLTTGNTSLVGLVERPSYTVARALLLGPSGVMWACLFHSLVFAFPDGYNAGDPGMYHVAGPFLDSGEIMNPRIAPTALAIDHNGILWIGTEKDGVLLIDTGGTPLDGSDDQFVGELVEEGAGSGVGLPSRSVSSIAVGRDGTVWVGTDKGLSALSGTYDRQANAYALSSRSYTASSGLPSSKVQTVIVDSLNVKWVGTDVGLGKILPSGQVVSLASNRLVDPSGNVVALAFDARRGYLWVGTPRGLNRYEAYPPEGEAEKLIAQPSESPYRIGLSVRGRDYVLTGRPLTFIVSPGATVRVYTLTGELVWEGTDGGIGQLSWDGRTRGGAGIVASGVYLYLAEIAGQKKIGKIAVLRDAR